MINSSQQAIRKLCFVNAPWQELKDTYLDFFIKERLQPEISLEGLHLYDESPDTFKYVADRLHDHDLPCTFHAPFFDLAPGALDPVILEASREKLRRAFQLIPLFRPRSIVCHLQFEENKQGYKYEQWRAAALATWQELIEIAAIHNTPVMLENTYEHNPAAHEDILGRLNHPQAQFCLDVGHLMSFAQSPWQEWLPRLSPWLGQLHLHDNHGKSDEHLAPGRGHFDFSGLFSFLRKNQLRPLVTLEPHSEDDLWAALDYLERTKILEDW